MNEHVGWPTFAILVLFFAGFAYVVLRMHGDGETPNPGPHVVPLIDAIDDAGSYRRHAWGPDAGGVVTGQEARLADAGSADPGEPGQ